MRLILATTTAFATLWLVDLFFFHQFYAHTFSTFGRRVLHAFGLYV